MEQDHALMAHGCRLGVVSFLNAKPLISGLELDPTVSLIFDVPSRLPALLDSGAVDAALIPTIDLLNPGRNWQVVSDACIGCDGETLTVRVFSRVPAAAVRRLHVDGDSHTSVALARIIWRELYRADLEITPYSSPGPDESGPKDDDEAILLIGDKVVTHRPIDYDIETDLGSAWKSLTSLPFVFAAWAAPLRGRQTSIEQGHGPAEPRRDRPQTLHGHAGVDHATHQTMDDGTPGVDLAELGRRLSEARDRGVEAAEMIAADYGPGMGWPVALAKRYLTTRLNFFLGQRQRAGMQRFLELARTHGLVPAGRELVFA